MSYWTKFQTEYINFFEFFVKPHSKEEIDEYIKNNHIASYSSSCFTINLNMIDKNNLNVLFHIVIRSESDVDCLSKLKLLIEKYNVNYNGFDSEKYRRLPYFTCVKGYLESTKYLLNKMNYNIQMVDKNEETIFFSAMRSYNIELVKYLDNRYPKWIFYPDTNYNSCIFSIFKPAFSKLDDEKIKNILRFIFNRGFDINEVNNKGVSFKDNLLYYKKGYILDEVLKEIFGGRVENLSKNINDINIDKKDNKNNANINEINKRENNIISKPNLNINFTINNNFINSNNNINPNNIITTSLIANEENSKMIVENDDIQTTNKINNINNINNSQMEDIINNKKDGLKSLNNLKSSDLDLDFDVNENNNKSLDNNKMNNNNNNNKDNPDYNNIYYRKIVPKKDNRDIINENLNNKRNNIRNEIEDAKNKEDDISIKIDTNSDIEDSLKSDSIKNTIKKNNKNDILNESKSKIEKEFEDQNDIQNNSKKKIDIKHYFYEDEVKKNRVHKKENKIIVERKLEEFFFNNDNQLNRNKKCCFFISRKKNYPINKDNVIIEKLKSNPKLKKFLDKFMSKK